MRRSIDVHFDSCDVSRLRSRSFLSINDTDVTSFLYRLNGREQVNQARTSRNTLSYGSRENKQRFQASRSASRSANDELEVRSVAQLLVILAINCSDRPSFVAADGRARHRR